MPKSTENPFSQTLPAGTFDGHPLDLVLTSGEGLAPDAKVVVHTPDRRGQVGSAPISLIPIRRGESPALQVLGRVRRAAMGVVDNSINKTVNYGRQRPSR